MRIGTAESTAVVAAIEDAVDPGLLASDGAEVIGQNHVGEIELALSRPIAIDPYTADPNTGRIVLEFEGRIAGGGLILTAQAAALDTTSGPRPGKVASTARASRTGVNSDELRAKASALAQVFASTVPGRAHRLTCAGRLPARSSSPPASAWKTR